MSKFRVGYADMVGDLLHWGHIRFLENCKKQCDFLVVGIEPDESATKGKRKPIIPYDNRVETVDALRCVDEVRKNISWDATGTLKQLHREGYNLKFWFHGDDNEYPEAKAYIESIGGVAIITPYVAGVSTTKIIDIIIERYCKEVK